MEIDWLSSYTDKGRLDILSKVFTLAMNSYFNENYICQEVEISINRTIDNDGQQRDFIVIERIE